MIRDLYRYLAAVAVSTALLSVPAQSFQQDSAVFTLVVTRAGLDVGESFLQDGDVESARYAVEFASKNFASGLQDLRSHDPGLTDQIHLELLDLPLALAEGAEPDAAQLIGSVLSKIGGYGIQEDGSDAIIVDLLTVADEQYVLASDDNAPAYEIAKILFRESKSMFEHDADLEVMLDLEQQSFFNDLERSVEDRDSFLKVGTLVSAIQSDLLGDRDHHTRPSGAV